jgi:hypothetical protein
MVVDREQSMLYVVTSPADYNQLRDSRSERRKADGQG